MASLESQYEQPKSSVGKYIGIGVLALAGVGAGITYLNSDERQAPDRAEAIYKRVAKGTINFNYDKNGISSTAWVKRGKNPDSLVFEYDIKPPNSFNMAAARLYSAEEPKTMSFFLVDERPWGSPDSCAQRFTSESGEITDVNIPFTAISQNEYSKTLDALYRDASK